MMPGPFSDIDAITIERFTLIEAERQQLRSLVTHLAKTMRSLLELHDPKEASSFEAQQIRTSAAELIALVELLPRTVTPTS